MLKKILFKLKNQSFERIVLSFRYHPKKVMGKKIGSILVFVPFKITVHCTVQFPFSIHFLSIFEHSWKVFMTSLLFGHPSVWALPPVNILVLLWNFGMFRENEDYKIYYSFVRTAKSVQLYYDQWEKIFPKAF